MDYLYLYWSLQMAVGEGTYPTMGELLYRVREVYGVAIAKSSAWRALKQMEQLGVVRSYRRTPRLVVWGL